MELTPFKNPDVRIPLDFPEISVGYKLTKRRPGSYELGGIVVLRPIDLVSLVKEAETLWLSPLGSLTVDESKFEAGAYCPDGKFRVYSCKRGSGSHLRSLWNGQETSSRRIVHVTTKGKEYLIIPTFQRRAA